MPENFLEINRHFALTSYCNTIGQSNNVFSILGFSLGKRRGYAFYLFIDSLIKQIMNTYGNHFSMQGHMKIVLTICVDSPPRMMRRVHTTRISFYYGQFAVSMEKESPYFFSKCNPLNADTHNTDTFYSPPQSPY